MSRDLRNQLKDILPSDKLNLVSSSFEVIGSKQKAVAIIEISGDLKDSEILIASAIMKLHKNVTSVLAKESERDGDFRTRKLRLIAGETNTEVVHKESGTFFKLDPSRVYFSPRESAERERLSNKAKDGESILVMFSGVCPIPIILAKKLKNIKIVAVELNPEAYNYCVQNIHLNKVEDRVEALLGDVREICPNLKNKFDRIIMPLPKGAYQYLDCAVSLLADGGVVHFYHWAPESDLFKDAEKLLVREAQKQSKSLEILEKVKVSQYSPRVWKVRLDAKLS